MLHSNTGATVVEQGCADGFINTNDQVKKQDLASVKANNN